MKTQDILGALVDLHCGFYLCVRPGMEPPMALMGGSPAVRKCFCSAGSAAVKGMPRATLLSGSGTHWSPCHAPDDHWPCCLLGSE